MPWTASSLAETANSSPRTFPDLAITPGWQIIAVITATWEATAISSVTAGGNSATLMYALRPGSGLWVEYWKVNVASGSTADIVVTPNGSTWALGVAICSVPGEPTYVAEATQAEPTGTTGALTWSQTINVPANGGVVGIVGWEYFNATTADWTGLTAGFTNFAPPSGVNIRVAGAQAVDLSEQTGRAVGVTVDMDNNVAPGGRFLAISYSVEGGGGGDPDPDPDPPGLRVQLFAGKALVVAGKIFTIGEEP